MHDLMRLYAQRLSDEHAQADNREQARDRLLDYYLAMAGAADKCLRALPGMAVPDEFAGRDGALEWLDAERASLVPALTMAAETGRDQAAMRLPITLTEYFGWRRRFDDWIAAATISLDAARRLGDQRGEGDALTILGLALQEVRRFDEATTACQDAAAIYRETGEGLALGGLGLALQGARRFAEAITAYQDALEIYRETGDQYREGITLNNLEAVQHGVI
jgi:tetratricopeptide (TPR) repeat protein